MRESAPQRSRGDGDSAAAKFTAWELWGFYMKPPQNVRKTSSPLSSVWRSPPDLLRIPRSGQSGPCGHLQARAGGRSIPGNPARGFNFPPALERKGSPEDLWAPCSSCRFINSLSQVLGTWGPWGNAERDQKQRWVPPPLPSPRV